VGLIDWTVPENTIINPPTTSPVSLNTPCGAGYVLIGVVTNCISQMYLCSDFKHEAYANGSNAFNNPQVHGTDRRGSWFMTMMMENLISGAGALIDRDGDDTSANMWTNKPQVTNLERAEELFPWLYLWRIEAADTGGPGKFREVPAAATCSFPGVRRGWGCITWVWVSAPGSQTGFVAGIRPQRALAHDPRLQHPVVAGGRPMPTSEAEVEGRREPRSRSTRSIWTATTSTWSTTAAAAASATRWSATRPKSART